MPSELNIKKVLSKKRVVLVVLICLGLTAFLFYHETKDSEFVFSDLNFTFDSLVYLFLSILMMMFRDLAYMFRIRILTDKVLSWKKSFNVIMLWEFASALTPGIVGGSAIAMFILQKEKIPLGKATSLVLITAIMDNLFYLIFLPLVLLSIPLELLIPADMNWLDGNIIPVIWFGYLLILAITAILVSSLLFFPGLIKGIFKLIYLLPFLNKRKEKGEQIGRDVIISSKEIRHKSFRFWIQTFLFTVWSWTARYLVINFILLAFIEIGMWDHVVIFARQLLMWLVLIIPVSPGGSGVAEYLFTDTFSDLINNGGIAISLAFIWRLISYYPYLIIGLIILPRWLK